jgi:hypothetical protein
MYEMEGPRFGPAAPTTDCSATLRRAPGASGLVDPPRSPVARCLRVAKVSLDVVSVSGDKCKL